MDEELTLSDVPDDETSVPDLEPTYGPDMECEGRYEVDPIPGGKRFQGSWLILDDGTRYVLSYRPHPDHYRFVDKRVRVMGRPYTPGRDTQHMLAKHFQIISIALAPGEIPYAEPPTTLPSPPLLRTERELNARAGQWAQVVGRLIALEDDPDSHFHTACIELEDGGKITALYAAKGQWEPYLGSTITVTSRIEVHTSDAVSAGEQGGVVLTGWYAICEGESAT
jgi:hypothetical protein